MNELFVYLLKVSIVTGVLYSCYSLLLQKTTFHQLNRFFILFTIAFSISCPFWDLSFAESNTLNTNYLWINEFDQFSISESMQQVDAVESHLLLKHIIVWIYWLGVVIFFLRSVIQLRAIFRLKRAAVKILKEDTAVFVYSDKIKNPFSFFKWIFLPVEFYKKPGNSSIIEHEKVHVKQLHSLDIILSEVCCILFWFNPFVFLLQKSLKRVHEYIADNQVVRSNKICIDQYLRLLVSATESKTLYGMTSSFKSSMIKKRIQMMTNKSSKKSGFRYILMAPVVAIMLLSFSEGNTSKDIPSLPAVKALNEMPSLPAVKTSNDIPSIRPVTGGGFTARFGPFEHPITKERAFHNGIDIRMPEGTSVMSTASGEVIEASEKEGWGKLVVIRHADGYETRYAHLSKLNVSKGDQVKKAQEIALSGNTGLSTGPHLHYEVRKDGEPVNPEEYFE